ncbi:hypothetical protein NBRC3280_2270 [Acetobacter pasteurianus NBRC 3280]|uniref:Uncharacterized protein n=1 Tax=Acetobacter pasteurianus NBRC 3278 TaxID=1226660 RepID=A0A401X608_ACEPA|nr:hypothetical protein [Acetobacter pasteurianus]GCD59754.1 hypothetical protein NBRC3277_2329 [Acetobacter pasteurianus NBRC 3277]GCD63264.1 hypothetical protein NBRC3278_2357 [Acetobacter pasteurianus NBRC 3278]GCD69635.1 hypothetical protein NBRC3280_2270 [Acetobacter pasteurianus NBRC 3280]
MNSQTSAMTEAERDHLANYKKPHLLLHKAEQIARAIHDLSHPENEVVFPEVRYWLADELCSTLERLGNETGYNVRGNA